MSTRELSEYLKKARLSEYAAEGEGIEIFLDDGGKKFIFSKMTWNIETYISDSILLSVRKRSGDSER